MPEVTLSCLAVQASSLSLTPCVAPKPGPRGPGLCVGGRGGPKGHQVGVALTFSLPTAVCGGTSRPADTAPHWPGWHGGLCCAHDHRAGLTGELPHCGGGVAGWAPECASDPTVPVSAPAWLSAPRGQGCCSSWVCTRPNHIPLPRPGSSPAWCFLTTAPPASGPKFPLQRSCFAQY